MESIEGCDDGNIDRGDGCDGNCFLEDMWECVLSSCSVSKCFLKKPISIEIMTQVVFLEAVKIQLKSTKATLVVDAGTVINKTTFSIHVSEKTTCSQLYNFDKFQNISMISECFTFGPEDITFLKPVKIIIMASGIQSSSRPETHSIRRYDPAKHEWVSYPTVVKNDSYGISYQVQTTHFSTYALFEKKSTKVSDMQIVTIIVVGFVILVVFVCMGICCRTKKRKTRGAEYSPLQEIHTCRYCQNTLQ